MAKSEKIIISVELTDKGLKASSSKAKKAIDGVTESTSKLEKATKDLAFQQTKEAEELAKMQLKAQLATKANKELAVSTLSAASAAKQGRTQNGLNNAILTETGRMASDAAYGMRGMANNLGQLMSLMNQHAQTRGGFAASFKELGRSLMGTGGVLIALQLLISWSPEIEKFFRKLIKDSARAGGGFDYMADALKNLDKETHSAIGNLSKLVNTVNNVNASDAERIKALIDLNEEYPELNKNIDEERKNLDKLNLSLDDYIKLVVRRSALKALEEEIGKESLALYKAQKESNELYEKFSKKKEAISVKELERMLVHSQEVESGSKSAQEGLREYQNSYKQLTIEQHKWLGLKRKEYKAQQNLINLTKEKKGLDKDDRKIKEGTIEYLKLLISANDERIKQEATVGNLGVARRLQKENKEYQKQIDIILNAEKEGRGSSKRVIKDYEKRTLKLGQILLKWQNQLKKTTKRNEQEIIRDTGENSKEIIRIKRTEFEDIEKERLKSYIAKQEALVKGKKITRKDADIAIGIAKERSEASINKANEEADGVIEAIDRVTEARIANQIKIEELNALKRGSKEEESFASNTVDMMPEGMEKINAEKALSDLRYSNKVAAAEAELAMLAENSEEKKNLLSQMSMWEDERRVVDLQNEIDVVNEKQRVNEEYLGFLSGISGVLSTLAGESELVRKTALVLEKGAAIASVIGKTNAANSNIARQSSEAANDTATEGLMAINKGNIMMASGNVAQGTALLAAGNAGIASAAAITAGAKTSIGKNRIGAGIAIAGILAESIVGLDSGGRGASSTGGGGGATVQPPDFNIIGSTGTNQLAEAIGTTTKLPIKAYVVSSDVTSAQEMDRNIVESSSIG